MHIILSHCRLRTQSQSPACLLACLDAHLLGIYLNSTCYSIIKYQAWLVKFELPVPLCSSCSASFGLEIFAKSSLSHAQCKKCKKVHGPEIGHCTKWISQLETKLMKHFLSLFFSFILLIHKGSRREVYQEFKPSYDIFRRWCQGLFRPQVPCTPSLHCPIANSASTQSQQPV